MGIEKLKLMGEKYFIKKFNKREYFNKIITKKEKTR